MLRDGLCDIRQNLAVDCLLTAPVWCTEADNPKGGIADGPIPRLLSCSSSSCGYGFHQLPLWVLLIISVWPWYSSSSYSRDFHQLDVAVVLIDFVCQLVSFRAAVFRPGG
jgi:hypothetical protein